MHVCARPYAVVNRDRPILIDIAGPTGIWSVECTYRIVGSVSFRAASRSSSRRARRVSGQTICEKVCVSCVLQVM